MNAEDKLCGTCRFWCKDLAVDIKVPAYAPHEGRLVTIRCAPCRCNAVEPDAGFGAVVLMGPESHCQSHADAWEPVENDYAEPESVYDGYGENDFGCVPGVDFPATLSR